MSVGAGGPREGADVPEALVQAAHGSELPPQPPGAPVPPSTSLKLLGLRGHVGQGLWFGSGLLICALVGRREGGRVQGGASAAGKGQDPLLGQSWGPGHPTAQNTAMEKRDSHCSWGHPDSPGVVARGLRDMGQKPLLL